jgi:hypothetical protein
LYQSLCIRFDGVSEIFHLEVGVCARLVNIAQEKRSHVGNQERRERERERERDRERERERRRNRDTEASR